MKTVFYCMIAAAALCGCSGSGAGGNNVAAAPVDALAVVPATAQPGVVQVAQTKINGKSVIPFVFNGSTDIQQKTSGNAHATTVSCTFTNTPAQNDTLIFALGYYNSGTVTVTAPSGVTNITKPGGAGGDKAEFDYLIAGSGQSKGPYTYTISSSSYQGFGCEEIAGAVTSGNPVDAHGETAFSNATTITSASVTPITSGDLPLFFVWNGNRNAFTGLTSGWTNDQNITSNEYQFDNHGPIAGTGTVQASLTLTGGGGYGGTEMLLLKPSSTPTPTPTPSPTPPPGGAYSYQGCQVFTANDWFTTDLTVGDPGGYVPTSVDPNSATVISTFVNHFGTMTGGTNGTMWYYNDGQNDNLATSSTAMVPWSGCSYGCHPSGGSQPWTQGTFVYEGGEYSPPTTCATGKDCHGVSMTGPSNFPSGSGPCMEYEAYNSNGTLDQNGKFVIEFGGAYNLANPFNGNGFGGGPTMAGIPYMGTTNWGEDSALSSINHSIAIWLPNGSPVGTNDDSGGAWVAPGLSSAGNCTTSNGCSVDWLFSGDRLRLNQSKFSCSSINQGSYPNSYLVCLQMAHYGLVVADYSGNSGYIALQFGKKLGGLSSGWNATGDLAVGLFKNLTLSDFDLMKRCGGNKTGPLGSGSWGTCSGP